MNLFFLVILFFSFCLAESDKSAIAIKIMKSNNKKPTFVICGNDNQICQNVKKNLESTKRIESSDSDNKNYDVDAILNIKTDFVIKITRENNKVCVEIFDIAQQRKIKTIDIAVDIPLSEKNILELKKQTCNVIKKIINVISDIIYKLLFDEPGICDTSIIFATKTKSNIYLLNLLEYSNDEAKVISSEISYLASIYFYDGLIYLTKFMPQYRGYAIFTYNMNTKKFHNTFAIQHASVFSPFIDKNIMYISVSKRDTTAVYSIQYDKNSIYFPSFINFEKYATSVLKINEKIVTNFSKINNVNEESVVYCTNHNSKRSAIVKNGVQISDDKYAYYEPVTYKNKKLAAIKISNNMFHLILIDLQSKEEKTLFSKYYISKPCFSPCGNWIVICAKEKGEMDDIVLIHKSGKYIRTIKTNFECGNPIWLNN